MNEGISVLIPAYNEGERIAKTVLAVRATVPSAQIVVIDDGSTDDTAQQAELAGADIVWRQPNGGKGAALRAGLEFTSGDILLLLDGDLATTAQEALKLLAPLLNGSADMTIATFPGQLSSGSQLATPHKPPNGPLPLPTVPPINAATVPTATQRGGMGLVVRLARTGIRMLTGRTMAAPLSGQRAIRLETLLQCGGFADGWGVEVALTVRVLRAGYRVVEVPTCMAHRVTGRSWADIRHRAAQFCAVARTLFQLLFQLALNPATHSHTYNQPGGTHTSSTRKPERRAKGG